MTHSDHKPLPLGQSSFSTLIETGAVYVDKTDLIYRLAVKNAKVFLSRPRRFGKSLLVSTFESLFKHGLRDFKGLAIETKWTDKTYRVVRLDFSECREFQSVQEFERKFSRRVALKFQLAGIELPHTEDDLITRLSYALEAAPDRSLVLLIDEYDAPLTCCLDKPELFEGVRSVLSDFFLTVKSQSACLRFLFLTGITKYSHTSIFFGFNFLDDISLNEEYGTLLGLTEEEIQRDFAPYIQHACCVLGLDQAELVARLRENYDGFSFDKDVKTHVYCPWSVLKFLEHPNEGFANYWYDSAGQPNVLMQYLKGHELADPMSFERSHDIDLSALTANSRYSDMRWDVLLTQAGYLTFKEVNRDGTVRVGYPNREIENSMARLYAKMIYKGQSVVRIGESCLDRLLESGDVEGVVRHFNRMLNDFDYVNYPIVNENICRTQLMLMLKYCNLSPVVEKHSALGRSDLEVTVGRCHWVFEFKLAREDDDPNALLQDALEQIVAKRYGCSVMNKTLVRVAMVFGQTERQFVAWQRVDEAGS